MLTLLIYNITFNTDEIYFAIYNNLILLKNKSISSNDTLTHITYFFGKNSKINLN